MPSSLACLARRRRAHAVGDSDRSLRPWPASHVRNASSAKGEKYPDDLLGIKLMRTAFHPDTGPLTNSAAVYAEREAEMHLFSGAIGHAKNPISHRDVNLFP